MMENLLFNYTNYTRVYPNKKKCSSLPNLFNRMNIIIETMHNFQSITFHRAVFMCEWYNYSQKFNRIFRIIFERTKQPLLLRAVIIPVTMSTFLKVCHFIQLNELYNSLSISFFFPTNRFPVLFVNYIFYNSGQLTMQSIH